ncbi:hypothetical protein [Bradyrhizobium sp. DOA9]|uniref:hypothetical protein n=1 Tax=Bradyrhizobium sp. DOA9 TaxID=1126627 RepID=UPI000469462C|nr:hypothetical protein [Bradyrhizobium sp. DOA9]GAJ31086.1 hypothetical protein BDOA9_0102590 [Bradyrhizobium sp. DOA9]
MTTRHILDGLIKWSMRDRWAERFEAILEDHLIEACDEAGLGMNDIVSILGEDLFMSTAWACAFEDFLTREFERGGNAIDDYLKRGGRKESASVRTYLAAMRHSVMSLYEVSDIVRGTSFLARDLIRGGDPVLISERSATQSLRSWDRIAARLVQVGPRTEIGGGLLVFDHETSEILLESLERLDSLSSEEKRELAEANGYDFDDEAFMDLSPTERLRVSAPIFTTFWLIDAIDRVRSPQIPDVRNAEGDEVMLCEARFPLAARTAEHDIRAGLEARPEFRATSSTSWSWVADAGDVAKPAAMASKRDRPLQETFTYEAWSDEDSLVLADIRLDDRTLVLSTNSKQRCDRGCALLSDVFGRRLRKPRVETTSIEQIIASRNSGAPQQFDIPEDEQRAIVHDYLDRHYRDVLDQPVPALGGQTPRAAVKTAGGRIKVVEWLKFMENRSANPSDPNNPMDSYDFTWLWTELGLSELRE